MFVAHNDELKLSNEWRDEIENSTDIIVFGSQNAMEAFREHETVDRRVWEHGFKFSFGLIRSEQLTPSIINRICFDFFSFYGEGSLAPKFYFILGKLTKKQIKEFSAAMITLYGEFIESYRDKLPLTRKSELVQKIINFYYYFSHYLIYALPWSFLVILLFVVNSKKFSAGRSYFDFLKSPLSLCFFSGAMSFCLVFSMSERVAGRYAFPGYYLISAWFILVLYHYSYFFKKIHSALVGFGLHFVAPSIWIVAFLLHFL